jgi:hypothetical protein
MIDDNENENLKQAIHIVGAFKERDNTLVYVFSTRIESELLLTAVDKGKIKVRRINHIQSLISRVLYENGTSLFEQAKQAEDGVKDISAVIVGMGRHGTEMLKALSWYCQMDGYRVEINGFDIKEDTYDKFKAEAPDLLNEKYNGVDIPGEAQYKIAVYSGVNVEGYSFCEQIKNIKNASVVELEAVKGINRQLAEEIYKYYRED